MRALTLAGKDLRIYFRDRAGILLGLGLPVVLATVFGAAMGAMGGGGEGVGRVKLVVEDRDGSEASARLVAALSEAGGLRVDLVGPEDDPAREDVSEGDAPAGLLIEPGYGAALAAGEPPPLVLYRDPSKQIEEMIVAASLVPALFEAGGEELARAAVRRGAGLLPLPEGSERRAGDLLEETFEEMWQLAAMPAPGPEDESEGESEAETGGEPGDDTDAGASAGAGGGLPGPGLILTGVVGVTVEDVVGGGDARRARKIGVQAHAVAGIAVMMLLFGLVSCGGTLLEEEAAGTIDRLRLTSGTGAILGGKFLSTFVIGLLQLGILFLYGRAVFEIPIFRSPLALFVVSACVAASATGFGILFAVLCRTQKQLEGLATIVILTMSAVGGAWFPLAMAPEWFRTVGHFTLTAWAMDGYQAIFWYGKGLTGVLPEVGVLLAIAAVTSGLAFLVGRRRIG